MASPSPPPTASSTSSSPHRKLLHSLIYWAVQRCRVSESPCRLTVSVKRSPEPARSSPLRIAVSDTGVGSKLEEFLELDALARDTPVEKWDGTLLITTTGINDKTIYHYQFNLQQETSSSARFTKLSTTYKSHAIFSGTEVSLCLSNEADVDDFILWLVGFVHKNLACELFIEQTDSAGSGNVCMSQGSDDVHLPITTSSIDRLVSGLKDYALSHGNASDKCEACYMNRDCLKIGTGAVNNVDRRKAKGQFVEVVIMIAHTSSDLSCWISNCSSTQVLHFEDFIPCPISQSSFNVLMSIDWQSYGFKLKGGFMDDDGNAVLQWDNITFARVDIAIHTYHGGAVNEWKISQPERHLVRKALKSALLGLKVDHAEDFLSCHGQKVREYVPDLAESIAGLILSSSDQEFQDECIALLGLGSDQDLTEGSVRSCIGEKMNRIIEMNDTKDNVEHNSPYLFECEKIDEDSQLDEDDADQDMILDF
uniref:Type 2 DNA topoisomerase 6 subunit B-like n=1 Tax=Oryza brachyantha TaxID=4533 RepID=J3MHH7_ORYBR